MGYSVAVNGFNVGSDASVTISDAYGDVFPAEALGHLTDFSWASTDALLTCVPISNGGVPIFQTIWQGVSGSMAFARVNGLYTKLISELMVAYHTQGLITQFSASVEVLNRDGTLDEYLLSNMQIHKNTFGNFRGTKEADFSFQFSASLLSVAGGTSTILTGLPMAA